MSASFDDNPADAASIGLDLTSMIDVTFLLIIFWIVVTSFSPDQPRELELPQATVAKSASGGSPVSIDITSRPVRPIYLAGGDFSAEELNDYLASRPLAGRDVVLRADRRADAAMISRVARDCYRHGAGSVAFSLKAEE